MSVCDEDGVSVCDEDGVPVCDDDGEPVCDEDGVFVREDDGVFVFEDVSDGDDVGVIVEDGHGTRTTSSSRLRFVGGLSNRTACGVRDVFEKMGPAMPHPPPTCMLTTLFSSENSIPPVVSMPKMPKLEGRTRNSV